MSDINYTTTSDLLAEAEEQSKNVFDIPDFEGYSNRDSNISVYNPITKELKPPVAYRFIPNGEPIMSHLDVATRTIVGFPDYVYDQQNLVLPSVYIPEEYNKFKYPILNFAEAALLADPSNCIAIDTNNYGYRVMKFNGLTYWTNIPGLQQSGEVTMLPLQNVTFKSIGYRPSKVMQYRCFTSVFQLQYNTIDNCVYTNDGIFELGLDYEELSDVSPTFEGYSEMIKNNHFAVVYIDSKPVFLKKSGDFVKPI